MAKSKRNTSLNSDWSDFGIMETGCMKETAHGLSVNQVFEGLLSFGVLRYSGSDVYMPWWSIPV